MLPERRWEFYNAKGSIYQDGNLRHIRTQRTVFWSVAINGLSVLSLTTQLETASDLKVTPFPESSSVMSYTFSPMWEILTSEL